MERLALYALWVAYLGAFAVNHLRVRAARKGAAPERRVAHARSSDAGMTMQFLGVLLTFFARRPESAPAWLAGAGFAIALAAVAVTWWGLARLGRQWRLQAVITDDHELVTTGPYAWVRHPVYTAFFGMLAANATLISAWWAGLTAAGLYIAGTEIRIRAEERILAERFPQQFAEYRARVAAWLPPLR